MHAASFVAVGLVFMMGFVAHRASLCTVRAVLEIMTTGRALMLATFVRASAWATAIAGALAMVIPGGGAGVMELMPHSFALLGGFVFGVGAAINGGCSLSTLQRLADGDLTMLASLAGLFCGASALMWVDHRLALTSTQALRSVWTSGSDWALPFLIALWLWVGYECLRLRALWARNGDSLAAMLAAHTYRLSLAAVLLGIAGGLLYAWQGAWTYTNLLRTEIAAWLIGVRGPASIQWGLLLALIAGMVLSAVQRGSFALSFAWRANALRRLAGGFMMGIGGALIPGGNDTLILAAIPALAPWAVAIYMALIAGVAVAMGLMRLLQGPMMRVECGDDHCR